MNKLLEEEGRQQKGLKTQKNSELLCFEEAILLVGKQELQGKFLVAGRIMAAVWYLFLIFILSVSGDMMAHLNFVFLILLTPINIALGWLLFVVIPIWVRWFLKFFQFSGETGLEWNLHDPVWRKWSRTYNNTI